MPLSSPKQSCPLRTARHAGESMHLNLILSVTLHRKTRTQDRGVRGKEGKTCGKQRTEEMRSFLRKGSATAKSHRL